MQIFVGILHRLDQQAGLWLARRESRPRLAPLLPTVPRVEPQPSFLSLRSMTLHAPRKKQRANLQFKERQLLGGRHLGIRRRNVHVLLFRHCPFRERKADRRLDLRPSDFSKRRTDLRHLRVPDCDCAMQIRRIEQTIRSQPQTNWCVQSSRRARPLDGLSAIRTQDTIPRRAPKRMAFVVKHQTPR